MPHSKHYYIINQFKILCLLSKRENKIYFFNPQLIFLTFHVIVLCLRLDFTVKLLYFHLVMSRNKIKIADQT